MEGYVKGIKQKIKKIIGLRNIIVIKRSLCYLKGFFLILEKEKIKLNENYIDGITELSQKGRNVFCGYYDVPIFDKKMKIFWCMLSGKRLGPDMIQQ
ncbi:hypothetical protein NSB25_21595 [Acetatifactor muris]|uniref:Uncharacterized protein n=1 Tax=Acetatifactor muris TaxID=879566 RepID=A0A2K4ZMA2_9FIRM|nr:hypothetical protein [Acetatifactor muris]MCR2049854.1 hypothetical protein [Acetatifactor muris]SOY31619.1 hypothetical protein AMURIS_04363 [Acetatifactor muris]